MNFVNAINALRGGIWVVFMATLAMILLYCRYHNRPSSQTGAWVDLVNSVHPAVYGFALCIMAYSLMLIGHSSEGEKVFLSGASFIGGVALRGAYTPNGSGTPAPKA